MISTTIAFDVDGVLRSYADHPQINWISLLTLLAGMKNVKIVVWSRQGKEHADEWVAKCDIKKYVWLTCSKEDGLQPDIAIDDQHEFNLGKINLIVRNR